MRDEIYKVDPSQPEGPHIDQQTAHELGGLIFASAVDSANRKSKAIADQQAEQMAKPTRPDLITEVPKL